MSTNCISCGFGEREPGSLKCHECIGVSRTPDSAGSAILGTCGPTAGCGKTYEMIENSGGVFENPKVCPHCGSELSQGFGISAPND